MSHSPVDRTPLLIVALAIGGALAGLMAGRWLHPARSPVIEPAASAAIVGQPRPAAELPDLDGRRQSLTQWDGQLILLNFWATWCGPCREEMPLLDRSQKRYAAKGLQIVGIASDNATATREFLQKSPVGYPILVDDPDHGGDLSRNYGDTRDVLPYTVLIGRDSRILARHFGNFSETALEQWLAPYL